jgi:hypothetical protein
MNTLNRFKAPVAVVIALVLPVLACSSVTDAQSAVCCTEFKAGATIDAKIGGSAQAQVAVQAVADFQGIASAAITDLTTACKSMATELDAPKAEVDAAEAKPAGKEQMEAYCSLAVKAIGTVKAQAGGTLQINVVPPKCEASVSAKGGCQAKCDVSGKCDIKANPPQCTGGSLQVACKGECTAKAGVALKCEGKCTGECKGTCNATGGVAVQCSGKCEGKCSADAQGGGNGVNAQGECAGFCDAKCTANATAPAVKCEGSCQGECSASCTGTAEASVKCDGECKADFEPLKCEGGKLEGGCKVDAKCDANCDASVSAKAECTPPSVTVTFAAAANAQAAGKLQAVLEANLGIVYAFKARLEGMAQLVGTITGNADAVAEIKASCIPAVIAAAVAAGADVQASVSATGSIVASL